MEYKSGKIGRVFVVRFDEGDNFLADFKKMIIAEDIRCGWFQVLGGIQEADVVTGPKKTVMPPEPVWAQVRGAREVLGIGSIFWEADTPKIHLHAALGHHGDTLCACMRENTRVYLVLEVYVTEVTGVNAIRPWFEKGGFYRVTFVD